MSKKPRAEKRPTFKQPREDHNTPWERAPKNREAKPLKPLNPNQGIYLDSIEINDLTFGLGPAGVGKTYLAAAWAAEQIRDKKFERLIITRPAVEAGESIGFLPGEMMEKFDPYFAPVRDVLQGRLGGSHVDAMLKGERIIVKPLAFMRGCSFKDAIVILDEAQNTTTSQMKMFLTRLGKGSKMIVNGDIKQTDLSGPNGLADATERLDGLARVGIITFTRDDIVRHGLVREIVDRYELSDGARLAGKLLR
jgi:phosphate starvation-inducible PhoH-like protein